jgi:hypothetical protein
MARRPSRRGTSRREASETAEGSRRGRGPSAFFQEDHPSPPRPSERHPTPLPRTPDARSRERSARETAWGEGGKSRPGRIGAGQASCPGRTFATDARQVQATAGSGRARRERCLPKKRRYSPWCRLATARRPVLRAVGRPSGGAGEGTRTAGAGRATSSSGCDAQRNPRRTSFAERPEGGGGGCSSGYVIHSIAID